MCTMIILHIQNYNICTLEKVSDWYLDEDISEKLLNY